MLGRRSISKLMLARRHVEGGRHILAAQEALVAKIKAEGGDAGLAEDVLQSFRQTQANFEEELQTLELGLRQSRAR